MNPKLHNSTFIVSMSTKIEVLIKTISWIKHYYTTPEHSTSRGSGKSSCKTDIMAAEMAPVTLLLGPCSLCNSYTAVEGCGTHSFSQKTHYMTAKI